MRTTTAGRVALLQATAARAWPTLLETARAVRAGAPLRDDVLLVFSDAEENGDLGAAAFAGQSPLIPDADVVLNWETAGSHGPSMLLGSNSSWLVKQVLPGAPHARTYRWPSLFRGLFGAQQLNTDTQEYMDRGVARVQFLYLRGQTDYHTVLDNTQRLGAAACRCTATTRWGSFVAWAARSSLAAPVTARPTSTSPAASSSSTGRP